MQKWREWQTASDGDWLKACQREAIIRPLADQTRLTKEDVCTAAKSLQTSRATLYRLIARFRQRPQTSSLLPWKRGRDVRTHFLDREREKIIEACIQEFYLTPQRPSMAALLRELRHRFAEQAFPPPNYRTVRRRLEALNARETAQKREGDKAARAKFGPVKTSSWHSPLPLNLVQIDHTLVDVIVVDQQEGLPIGRPWLTLAVDVASRMVTGFHVSLDPPSALAVSLVLTHAVLSKEQWLADRELSTINWPVAGIPRVIHVDNAKEFHSEALLRGCQEYSIQIEHRPPGRPHFGGHIERLIGTMMGAVHLLPGTTFSNVQQKGSYDSEAHAALTLPELERWLALQIAGVYHVSVHSQLGKSPQEAWNAGITQRKQPTRHPTSDIEFFLDFLSRLFVRDPGGQHWTIPYSDLGQPPVALWELLEARKRLRNEGLRSQSEQVIFDSILEQRRIIETAARTSRQRRRQGRVDTLPAPMSQVSKTQTDRLAAEVKPYPVEVWEE